MFSFMICEKNGFRLVSQRKLSSSFPSSQFVTNGYSNLYRLRTTDKRGGIMLLVKDSLRSLPVHIFCFSKEVYIFCTDFNLREQKWLML